MENKRNRKKKNGMSRRDYLKTSLMGTAGLFLAPAIVPSTVFGKSAPSNKIHIAQIGFGRISRSHNLPNIFQHPDARVVGVCDVDANRMNDGKRFVEEWYAENRGSDNYINVVTSQDYREILANSDVDAVVISTPDHAHFLPCVEASLAGKDIYMEKPMSITVEEGRQMSNTLHQMGTVFQLGSQQRSMGAWPQFKYACELVRNGRIGQLHTVLVGLPGDPPGGDPTPQPVPENLDYDAWLGTTPLVPYTEQRVHPQNGYGRPGWLRIEQFSPGMITGWGAHHVDTAHWGMDTEHTGPVELEAEAEFPTEGLWNVHGDFLVENKYANGVTMRISGDYPNGVRFEGDEGWIFVTRGSAVTADDPYDADGDSPLQASSESIIRSEIGPNDLHLYESEEHHRSWIDCVKKRQVATAAPTEVAHRSGTACLISHIAMKLPRKLYWDPLRERFKNDDEANSMLRRAQRYPYMLSQIPAYQDSF